jgi:membrane fusion protein (multidrug efflux system)
VTSIGADEVALPGGEPDTDKKLALWQQSRVQRAALAMVVIALAGVVVWWVRFRPFVSTEDARVAAPFVSIAPQGAGGRIEKVLVREGAPVHGGDVLAVLDSRAEQAQLARAQATVDLAEARLQQAETQLALAVAGPRREELDKALATLASVEARAAEQKSARDRAEHLAREGALSQAALDQARAADDQGRQAARAAQAELARLEHGARIEELALARGGVAEARARAAEARAELAAVEVALDRTSLRSSIDGVVVRVPVNPGDYVATGQAAVTIADLEHAWIAANIEETVVGRVHAGQPVQVDVDEGGTLRGRVDVVVQSAASQFALIPADNAAGNFTKVVQRIPIRVALEPGQAAGLRVGQSVELRIRVR